MTEEWDNIPNTVLINLINSMKHRCELIIENNGGGIHIKYLDELEGNSFVPFFLNTTIERHVEWHSGKISAHIWAIFYSHSMCCASDRLMIAKNHLGTTTSGLISNENT